jgi:hypothetical protein
MKERAKKDSKKIDYFICRHFKFKLYFKMAQAQDNNIEILGVYENTVQRREDGTFDADALVLVEERRRIYRINFRRTPENQIQVINAVDRNNIVQRNMQNEGRDNLRHNLVVNGIMVIYNIIKFVSFAIPFGLIYQTIGDNCTNFSITIGYLLLFNVVMDFYYYTMMYFNIRADPDWRAGLDLNRVSRLSWWINIASFLLSFIYLFGDNNQCGSQYDSFITAYVLVDIIESCLPTLFICCAFPIIILLGRYIPSGTSLDHTRLDALPVYKFDPSIIPSVGKSFEVVGNKIGFENEEEAEDAIDLTSYSEGDEVRLLRCKHHFKKETIDEHYSSPEEINEDKSPRMSELPKQSLLE